jgi:serine/threonine protein kinase
LPILTADERIGSILHGGPAFSDFRIERIVSRGGSSTVFEAVSLTDGSVAAVKVIDSTDIMSETAAIRFAREVHATKLVEHPNVVRLFGATRTTDGAPCLVLELLRGKTLKAELLERGKVPPSVALEWLLPVMGVLALLHDAGVVHRDIKPSNIFLDDSPERTVPKLLDFGIAKDTDATHLTRSGVVAGTPEYMAPEQASDGEIGPHTDVWAMGVVLYQALSGDLPFAGASSASVLVKIVHERPRPLLERAPNAGSRLCAAIDRALERSVTARYRDMRSFARALAVAAHAQGIELSESPDARGLPDFRRWLDQERSDGTETHEVTRLSDPGRAPALATTRIRARVALAALLGLALAGFALSSLSARTGEPRASGALEPVMPRQPPALAARVTEVEATPAIPPPAPNRAPVPSGTSARRARAPAAQPKVPSPPRAVASAQPSELPVSPPKAASAPSGASQGAMPIFPRNIVDTRW